MHQEVSPRESALTSLITGPAQEVPQKEKEVSTSFRKCIFAASAPQSLDPKGEEGGRRKGGSPAEHQSVRQQEKRGKKGRDRLGCTDSSDSSLYRQLCVIYWLLIKMSLAPESDVADAVAPGTPLQMTLGATTDFLSTYKQIHTQMREHKKAQFSTSKCGLCSCLWEEYFHLLLLQYLTTENQNAFPHFGGASSYTILPFSNNRAKTEYGRINRSVTYLPLTYTCVRTFWLTPVFCM